MTLHLPDSIKFVITDFDGIVTDNCVYINSEGGMSRKLNFRDVMAFAILRKNGYKIGIISYRRINRAAVRRAPHKMVEIGIAQAAAYICAVYRNTYQAEI